MSPPHALLRWLAVAAGLGAGAASAQYGPHPPPWIPAPQYQPGYWQPPPQPAPAPAAPAPAAPARPTAEETRGATTDSKTDKTAPAQPATGKPVTKPAPATKARPPTPLADPEKPFIPPPTPATAPAEPATPAPPPATAPAPASSPAPAALPETELRPAPAPALADLDRGVAAAERGNYAEAFCHWRPLAESGHAEAQYRLAWLYAKGLGLALNAPHALQLWRAAAEQGHAEAQFRVGWVHANGEGTKKDEAAAAQWFYKAAQQGHEDAQELFRHLWKRGSPEGRQAADALVKTEPGVFKNQPRIKAGGANLRAENHAKAKLITKLTQGDAVEVLERKGGWLKLRTTNGASGWVAAGSVNEDSP